MDDVIVHYGRTFTKECCVCGCSFEGHPRSRYCPSKVCQDTKIARAKAQKSAYAKKPAQREARRKYRLSERGKEIKRKEQSCPIYKAKRREHERLKTLERRVEYKHDCKSCGEDFTSYRSNSAFCNKKCQNLWWKGDEGRKYRMKLSKKRQEIPYYRITANIRGAINQSLKRRKITKHSPTFDILGYTGHDLVAHLESQFKEGMSWENRSEWHIDHIRPISSFDYTSTEDESFKECWALENLQPLWASENIIKGSKWNGKIWRETNGGQQHG